MAGGVSLTEGEEDGVESRGKGQYVKSDLEGKQEVERRLTSQG